MADQKIKVWITRYALTDGIRAVEAELDTKLDMVSYSNAGYGPLDAHVEGREWHRTPESALRRAEEMRKKRLASLRKQIARIEAMTFVAPHHTVAAGE